MGNILCIQVEMWRNYNVIITSKRRRDVILMYWMALSLRHVSVGIVFVSKQMTQQMTNHHKNE